MSKPLQWGIIGAGNIAHKLAEAVNYDPDSTLVAAASKTPGKAKAFAEKYRIDAHTHYEELLQRADIDVIYVATTHNFHFENTLSALEAGKHVLVEKPFTVNAKQAKILIDTARDKGLFLMEAIWVRFLPSYQHLKNLLKSGIIGKLRYITATFTGIAPPHYAPRLIDPALAGGVTLDMGIYPITFTNFLLDALPQHITSLQTPNPSGVDEIAVYQFKYPNECLASIGSSFNLRTKQEAMIYGTEGYIEFPNFQEGQSFTVYQHNGNMDDLFCETITIENHENGFIYQVAETVACIRAGKLQSDTITLNETLETMQLMDNMRADWGLKYPGE